MSEEKYRQQETMMKIAVRNSFLEKEIQIIKGVSSQDTFFNKRNNTEVTYK